MHAHQPLLMFILVTYAYLNFISYTKITLIGRHAMLLSYGDTSEHTVYGSERPWEPAKLVLLCLIRYYTPTSSFPRVQAASSGVQ